MFNGKSFNKKFLLTRKYYDFAQAINCTHKLTCACDCACACDCTHLREQYATVSHRVRISREFDSRKDSHSTRF